MRGGEKTCWRAVVVRGAGRNGGEPSRHERLAMLYRFQSGQGAGDVRFVDPASACEVTDPGEIDWTSFPVVDALEAVTRDELRRLRALLACDAAGDAQGGAPTPPNGLVWGVDLRRAVVPRSTKLD